MSPAVRATQKNASSVYHSVCEPAMRCEMRARCGVHPGEHRADDVEDRGVLSHVPERVCGENDVDCGQVQFRNQRKGDHDVY